MQQRNLVVTQQRICNFKDTQLKRAIELQKLQGLAKSTDPKNHQFIVHVQDDYDYHFESLIKEECFTAIKECYFNAAGKELPTYGIPTKDLNT